MKKGAAAKRSKPAGKPVASIRLPKTEILTDRRKCSWKVGDSIGTGGFGEIYLAERRDQCSGSVPPSAKHVIKIEPHSNGPLFSEINFYTRCGKTETIAQFKTTHKLGFLGMPHLLGHGQHPVEDPKYRFLVMQRCYENLDTKFVECGRVFPRHTVCRLAISILNVLEYLHSQAYVHADMKGSNILLASAQGDEVYVVDFGLAATYKIGDDHRAYKENPKRAHDGTIEFTSRDAHLGVDPSRRSDLEILGYVLLQWLCSRLPWQDCLEKKDEVGRQKTRYMADIPGLMRACFGSKDIPKEIESYLKAVAKLSYEDEPKYEQLRTIFSNVLVSNKWSARGRLEFSEPAPKAAKGRKPQASKVATAAAAVAAAGDEAVDLDDVDEVPTPARRVPRRRAAEARSRSRSRSPLAPTRGSRAGAARKPAAAARSPSPPPKGKPSRARPMADTRRKAMSAATVESTSPVPPPKRAGRKHPSSPVKKAGAAKKTKKTYSPASSKMPSPSAIWGPPKHIPG